MSKGPLKLFLSHSDKDEGLIDEMLKHLAPLERDRQIEIWHRRRSIAGDDVGGERDRQLSRADIVMVAMSADYLASADLDSHEVRPSLERCHAGLVRIVPVLLRPVDWPKPPLGHLQPLPGNKAITQWRNQDEAWLEVVRGLQRIVDERRERAQLEAEVQRLRAELQALSTRHHDLSARHARLEEEAQAHSRAHRVLDEEVQRQVAEATAPLQASVASLTAEVGSRQGEIDSLRVDVRQLMDKRREQQVELRQVKDEVERLKQQNTLDVVLVSCGVKVGAPERGFVSGSFYVINLDEKPIRLLSIDFNWGCFTRGDKPEVLTFAQDEDTHHDFETPWTIRPWECSETISIHLELKSFLIAEKPAPAESVLPLVQLTCEALDGTCRTTVWSLLSRRHQITGV